MKKTLRIMIPVLIILLTAAAGWLALLRLRSESKALQGAGLEIRFLDVGQGDAAIVLCDGAAMLIDGGKAERSSQIYSTLQSMQLQQLDYIVCTHPDDDHAGGLSGALNYAKAGTAFCSTEEADGASFTNFRKFLDRQGVSITVPEAGDRFFLGSAECIWLGPLRTADNGNDNSLVLLIRYGSTSVLFTGDAESAEEQDILAAFPDLTCTVLKVSHHGSSDASSQAWLAALSPAYAVISAGSGNMYGHPSARVLRALADCGAQIYRTDLQGTVICRSDGNAISFSVDHTADADSLLISGSGETAPTEAQTEPSAAAEPSTAAESTGETDGSAVGNYVCNMKSMKFHRPDCSGVQSMALRNRLDVVADRQELIDKGYSPCGICKP